MMKLLVLLFASTSTPTAAQWEPEELPVFMPSTQHELEHYEPVADKASVVLSPMAGERAGCCSCRAVACHLLIVGWVVCVLGRGALHGSHRSLHPHGVQRVGQIRGA